MSQDPDIFDGDNFAEFKDIIPRALDRGLTIHPVKPRGKEPWLNSWPKQASRDPKVISEWSTRFPHSNYGVAANDDFCILESDNVTELQARLGRPIPRTYTVQARANRPHYYFRQSEASKPAGNMDSPGVFEFKQNNRYVVGEGSVHPTGAVYECVLDAPIVTIPDWLVQGLIAVKSGRDVRVSAPMPTSGEKLGEGEGRHPMLMSAAAKLWDGVKTRDQFYDDLETINQEHCEPPKSPAHLLDIIDWIMERAPVVSAPTVLVGSVWGTTATALADRDVPVRNLLMVQDGEKEEPLFYESSINQILAWRGVGKTNFALGLAGCFARGDSILAYRALRPCRVLYIDGELPLYQLRERASSLCLKDTVLLVNPEDITPPESINLLSDRHWDKLLQAVEVHKPEVLFIDSLSTTMRMRSNEEEDQIDLQIKLNILRNRYHLCVVTLHHTGKNGLQRGLSRNDDILDVQMHLKKVDGWEPGDGLKFEMAFEKVRHAAHLESGFEVEYKDGKWLKHTSDRLTEVAELLKEGKSVRSIATDLDIPKSNAARLVKKAREKGLVTLNAKVGQ